VAPERVFFLEIQDLFAAGVTEGWGSGGDRTFQPDSDNLRDAMIVFIHRAMGAPSYTAPKSSPFRDVDPGFVFYKEICWAYDEGITEGWGSGGNRIFRPLEPVKRDAVAAFLYRAAGEPSARPSDADAFVDVPRDHVFATEIGWLWSSGTSRGWDDGTFRPDAYSKRDQIATVVMRWMKPAGRYGGARSGPPPADPRSGCGPGAQETARGAPVAGVDALVPQLRGRADRPSMARAPGPPPARGRGLAGLSASGDRERTVRRAPPVAARHRRRVPDGRGRPEGLAAGCRGHHHLPGHPAVRRTAAGAAGGGEPAPARRRLRQRGVARERPDRR